MNRLLDIALALPLLVLSSPIVLAAALWIRMSSVGPAVFSQQRVGRHEKPFQCHKLRTMFVGTQALPTHQVGQDSITPAGRFLRRVKLDELPQLWNVLKGEMSLVGPRPCLATQRDLIRYRRELGVYALRPGISGLAQVRGIDMSDPRRCAETDAEYLATRSLLLDAKILLATVGVRFS